MLHSVIRSIMSRLKKLFVLVSLLALAALKVNAGQIVLATTYSDHGNLAAAPKLGCVSGIVVPTTTPDEKITWIRLKAAGQTAYVNVPTEPVNTSIDEQDDWLVDKSGRAGWKWIVCLRTPVVASSENRFNVTIEGLKYRLWILGETVIESVTIQDISFSNGYVFDGQSQLSAWVSASFAYPNDLLLTNVTRLWAEWAARNFYNITVMVTASIGPGNFAKEPTIEFPSVLIPWTRWDSPSFVALSQNQIGLLTIMSCIEVAMRSKQPAHCVQIAVASTRIEAHTSKETHVASAMITEKPYTIASTELVQKVGGLWNSKYPLFGYQPCLWVLGVGESNADTPAEYSVILPLMFTDLQKELQKTRKLIGYRYKYTQWPCLLPRYSECLALEDGFDDDDGVTTKTKDKKKKQGWSVQTGTVLSLISLHMYDGSNTPAKYLPPPFNATKSINSPFNTTALAQHIVAHNLIKTLNAFCFVRAGHLGYLTERDLGLHWADTRAFAAIDLVNCFQNQLNMGMNDWKPFLVEGPKLQTPGRIVSWNKITGDISIRLTYATGIHPQTGMPVDVAFDDVPRPGPVPTDIFQYKQFNGTHVAFGVAKNLAVVASGQSIVLNFTIDRPSVGAPTTLIYTYLSGFAQKLVMNAPQQNADHPHWHTKMGVPADTASVPLELVL
jgi:hypothetical protein